MFDLIQSNQFEKSTQARYILISNLIQPISWDNFKYYKIFKSIFIFLNPEIIFLNPGERICVCG